MSKNLHSVQLMTIPAPLFDFGDFVEWSLSFDGETIVYQGTVETMSWHRDEPDDRGCWDYGLRCMQVLRNGIVENYHTSDSVLESELTPWFRLGIDTGTDTGTEPKRFTNALTSVSI
jgi:hypothetical protein